MPDTLLVCIVVNFDSMSCAFVGGFVGVLDALVGQVRSSRLATGKL